MGQQRQHDPDLMPLTDADSLDDWEGVAAPGPVHLGFTVSVRFDSESATVVRSAARLSECTLVEFVRDATLNTAKATVRGSPSIRSSGFENETVEPLVVGMQEPSASPVGANALRRADMRELEYAGA